MHNKLIVMISIIIFLFGFVFIKHSKGYRENFGSVREYHIGPNIAQDESGESDESSTDESGAEGFLNINKLFKGPDNCPDEIIHREDGIYLYNTSKLEKPGINPIIFQKLDEYLNYVRMLRSKNINCPILYYRETYTTQNEKKYNLIPELSTTLPEQPVTKLYDANRSPNSIFNANTYPGFDPQDQYIGLNTPLDKMFNEREKISDNPMDANWGGRNFSDRAIRSGKYRGDEVIMEVA